MSLAHMFIASSPHCSCFSNSLIIDRRGVADTATRIGKREGSFAIELNWASNCRDFSGLAVPNVNLVANTVENGLIVPASGLEIPVTCYKILGVSEKAEKDEIVKAAMELRNSEVEEGYSIDVPASRQDLVMDMRDKLLFEAEYAGNRKEKIIPKTLCIPWTWLPASLCLLQEVGEAKLVLDIGRAVLQRHESKPYVHDILLSMALAECTIAKIGFEENKIYEGFEALARAQYLLRSKVSSAKLSLLTQIEESLEELAPACTLEILSIPNSERRKGAISALGELLRQGLDIESSCRCRVQDWACFLNQALNLLTASEIVELICWEKLAEMRRNKKSLQSQTQRRVVDFDCFFIGIIAHIALGFSNRQIHMITKAKTICECVVASDGVDLKFEESFCSFLLGQESSLVAFEKLKQKENNGDSNPKSFESATKAEKGKDDINCSLELWIKNSMLSLFPDTRDCSPYLASFFAGSKRALTNSSRKQKLPSSPLNPLHEIKTICKPSLNSSCINHLGEAVRQLAPANLDAQSDFTTSSVGTTPTCTRLKRNPEKTNWSSSLDLAQKVAFSTVLGCVLFGTFNLVNWRFGRTNTEIRNQIKNLKSSSSSTLCVNSPSFVKGGVWNRLGKVSAMLSWNQKRFPNLENEEIFQKSSLSIYHKREMDIEEAEEIIKQWQEIKADALGPTHQIGELCLVLDESMLMKWQELAKSAKEHCCFWRFVLLKMSVIRAEIISDEIGVESAEIEALLEEAAELVDGSQPKKPSYYSTYKVQYKLNRQDDRSWRICSADVKNFE